MTSSKKKRGKQRKAAKNREGDNIIYSHNASGDLIPVEINFVPVPGRDNTLAVRTEDQARYVPLFVKNGHGPIAEVLSTHDVTNVSFESSGIISFVLDFLKRCEDETFDKVMAEVGGDMVSPAAWIYILSKAALREESCRLQIIQNIGPLVRCMCADTKRLFYQSNKHWRESIVPFANLIGTFGKINDAKLLEALLRHGGLLASIVQWRFWEEHRPDIVNELNATSCANIGVLGSQMTQLLVATAYKRKHEGDVLTEGGKQTLQTIGSTSTVSKDYDPNSLVSYTAGAIQLAKINGDNHFRGLVQIIIEEADCVDKGVITEMIDLGINYSTKVSQVEYVTYLLFIMLGGADVKGKHLASDTRIGCAIRAGLIEMCLNLIERFLGKSDDGKIFKRIRFILSSVHLVSFHEKCAKAIRYKRIEVEEKLSQLQQNTNIATNANCRKLLGMVSIILDLNGAHCCRCNKPLDRKDVKRCNGCNRVTYCSKACQREDWINGGHILSCNKSCTEGQFQGRVWMTAKVQSERDAVKLEAIEQNVSMIQLKLFLDSSQTILTQASALGLPLNECVVSFNLRVCPPVVEVKRFTEVHLGIKEKKLYHFNKDQSNFVTCVYCSNIFQGELDEDGKIPLHFMQKLFPCEWLSQNEVK